MNPVLIFDCDGVLADTERDGHLPAFNQTFEAFDLPTRWSVEDYGRLLAIGGGKERLTSLLTAEFVAEAGLPSDPGRQQELVRAWHQEKTRRYTAMVRDGVLPGRPGVARLAREARAAGWRLAVASTSAEESVRAVLEHAVGPALAEQFTVFAGDIVRHKKPAPDIYLLALLALEADASQTIVIEDSAVGLRATLAAGLTTVITPSGYTANESFDGAALVVTCLGDEAGEPAVTLVDPYETQPDGEIHVRHLQHLLTKRPQRSGAPRTEHRSENRGNAS